MSWPARGGAVECCGGPRAVPRCLRPRRRGRLVGPRAGQPHRRAHRLQPGPVPADRPPAADLRRREGPRGRPAARGLGAGRRPPRGGPGRRRARGAPRGWAVLRRGRAAGRCAVPGMPCAASTSPSTARCRSGQACPARRPWSAPSAVAASDLLGLQLTGSTGAALGPRRRVRGGGEHHRPGADRWHGPVRRPALPARPRPPAGLPRRQRPCRCPSTSVATDWRCW